MADSGGRRLFVAIPLPPEVASDLAAAVPTLPGLRATKRENLHLTLKFLGGVEDHRLKKVLEGVQEAVEGTAAFQLVVKGALWLPHIQRPRLLAAALEAPDALLHLVERLEEAMAKAGFMREARAFRSHVTLARAKTRLHGAPPAKEVALPRITFTVDRVVAMESHLGRGGPTYIEMAGWELE